jgi:hypothetical protein
MKENGAEQKGTKKGITKEGATRAITRRLQRLVSRLKAMEEEVALWEASFTPPTREDVKEIFEGKTELTSALHLQGVLNGICFHLEEIGVLVEEQTRFAKNRGKFFHVHPHVARGLKNVAAIFSSRRGLRSVKCPDDMVAAPVGSLRSKE